MIHGILTLRLFIRQIRKILRSDLTQRLQQPGQHRTYGLICCILLVRSLILSISLIHISSLICSKNPLCRFLQRFIGESHHFHKFFSQSCLIGRCQVVKDDATDLLDQWRHLRILTPHLCRIGIYFLLSHPQTTLSAHVLILLGNPVLFQFFRQCVFQYEIIRFGFLKVSDHPGSESFRGFLAVFLALTVFFQQGFQYSIHVTGFWHGLFLPAFICNYFTMVVQ